MKKTISITILLSLTLSLLTPAFAQQERPSPPQDGDVVKITSNLVQVDAIVTDKDNNQVTNLSPDDFEVYQDGKLQKISSFSYVKAETINQRPSAAKPTDKKDKNVPSVPSPRVSPENAGRLITFVVDDGSCYASRIGMKASKEALEKFINEQMQPNDLVAIYQTRAGSSVFQQFTSDKTQLLAVARKVRWLPARRSCGNVAAGDFFDAARTKDNFNMDGQGQASFENEYDRVRREKIEDDIKSKDIKGTIGVLNYVVRGLERVAGRKTVFFLSDGIRILTKTNTLSPTTSIEGRSNPGGSLRASDALNELRDLTEQANRASVVFNTIDTRGVLDPSWISAEDEFVGFRNDIQTTARTATERADEFRNSQDGLFFLANETGGKFYQGSNSLDGLIKRGLNLEKGYYLLAYQPDEDTFKGKKFHKIEIKVKRSGLNVRSRSGFYGLTDESLRPKPRTADSDLYQALTSPLPDAGLNLRLTAFFGNNAAAGSFVRTLLHLDGQQLTFTDEPNGMKKAVFDVVAVTLDEKSEVVDQFNRTHTIRFPAANLESVRQNGVIYTADVPVKKAGLYNFRFALRDANSKKLGSAGQQIEVPELKKDKIILSDLIVSEAEIKNDKPIPPSVEKAGNEFAPVNSLSIPPIRRFRPGAILGYSYKIYNARLDNAAQPKLSVQVNLFRDGQAVTQGTPQPAQLEAQSDMTRINDYGFLRLQPAMLTGEYALQIVVKDLLTNETSSQWIDFEITN